MEKSRGRLKEILTTAVVIFLSVLLFIARFVVSTIPSEDYPWFTPIVISVFVIVSIGYVIYIIFFSKESIYGKKRLEKKVKAKNVSKEKTLRNVFESNDGRKQNFQNKKPDRVVTIAFVAIFVCLAIGSFYWFEYRPTEIKKNCSYVVYTIPEVLEITAEEAEASKKSNELCKESIKVESAETYGRFDLAGLERALAENECDSQHPVKVETKYQPSREAVRDATDKEFNSCLRRNGLL